MINPNTLQIGNLLLDLNGRICKVESVEPEINNCKIYAIYDPVTTPPFSPLPITEERLRDAGFTVLKNKAYFVYNEAGNIFQLNRVDDRWEFTWGAVELTAWQDLQNLVRLLTGKDI